MDTDTIAECDRTENSDTTQVDKFEAFLFTAFVTSRGGGPNRFRVDIGNLVLAARTRDKSHAGKRQG